MKSIDIIFSKLIKTPLIGDKERNSLTESFNALTSEFDKFRMCKEIEYGFCTEEFLKSI